MREAIKDKGRLLHIQNAIATIEEYSKDISFERLCNDKLLFGCIVYHIVIIGEASHMLTQEFKDAHPDTNWKAIKGMRNHIVHGYYQVNPEDVWDVLENDIQPLKDQVQQYLKEMD